MAIIAQEIPWAVASWQEAEAFMRHITDGMGYPLDEGIIETVVACNLLGFSTCQSCEGHLSNGLPYPWIDFETDEFLAFRQALEDASRAGLSAQEREARGARLVEIAASLPARSFLHARLEALLQTYYSHSPHIPQEWRLVIHPSSPVLLRLMPVCGYQARAWDDATRASSLVHAQAEMRSFTHYLKQLWQQRRGSFT